ncbi:hypothetical protein [Noviherbaspirillum pedocola]|uniref:hypothetical protein n=1 Tax=Noviherbaspirillum pedocola TaxID=2801341 RepID=UPI00190A7ADD|nr:hypothetical protein [Noviherbaspirillum pedocola]
MKDALSAVSRIGIPARLFPMTMQAGKARKLSDAVFIFHLKERRRRLSPNAESAVNITTSINAGRQ